MARHKIRFDNMGMDWNPNAPPFSPVWRDMLNMRTDDGYLQKRCSLKLCDEIASQPTLEAAGLSNDEEYAVFVYQTGYGEFSDEFTVVVTTRDVWLYDGSSWTSLQLTYETGTVDITNGTTALAGTGTAWDTENIQDSGVNPSIVELPEGSGDWYAISSVGSDTAITLASSYTGTTLSGASYKIKRVGLVCYAAVLFNGNLYAVHGGQSQGGSFLAPALIEVQDIFGGSPTTRALTSAGSAITSSVERIDTVECHPQGIIPLQSGHILLSSAPGSISQWESRVFHCDPTNPTKWTSDNGGFTDLVGVPGSIVAAGIMNQQVVVYKQNGVHVGSEKGVPDNPVSWSALPGVTGPRDLAALVPMPGGQHVYLDRNLSLRLFDGYKSTVLNSNLRGYELETSGVAVYRASFNPRREEYSVNASGERLVYSFSENAWRREDYAVLRLNATTLAYQDPEAAGGEEDHFMVGGQLNETGAEITYYLAESSDADEGSVAGQSDGGFYAETDDFDLRMAGLSDDREFLVDTVELRARGRSAGTESITVGVSVDGGASYSSVAQSVTMTSAEDRVYLFQGFTRQARARARVKITLPSTGASDIQISRIIVHALDAGTVDKRTQP